jgi:hypothetical protein
MWTFRDGVQAESPNSVERSRIKGQAEGDMPSKSQLAQFHFSNALGTRCSPRPIRVLAALVRGYVADTALSREKGAPRRSAP